MRFIAEQARLVPLQNFWKARASEDQLALRSLPLRCRTTQVTAIGVAITPTKAIDRK